MITLQVLQLD